VTRQTRKDRSEVECEPTASALPLKTREGGAPKWQLGKESTSYPRVPSMCARRAYVYFREQPGRRADRPLAHREKAWRIASNTAKLPEHCAANEAERSGLIVLDHLRLNRTPLYQKSNGSKPVCVISKTVPSLVASPKDVVPKRSPCLSKIRLPLGAAPSVQLKLTRVIGVLA
jgi:hypothetical protein